MAINPIPLAFRRMPLTETEIDELYIGMRSLSWKEIPIKEIEECLKIHTARDKYEMSLFESCANIFLLPWLLVLANVGWGSYIWLSEGYWPEFSLEHFLDTPNTGWLGLNRILTWIWQQNAALLVAITGVILSIAIGIIGAKLVPELERNFIGTMLRALQDRYYDGKYETEHGE